MRLEWTLDDWTRALAGPTPTPAGGALALVTLGGGAALVVKLARLSGRATDSLGPGPEWFLEAAAEDGALYEQAARGGAAERHRCLEAGVRHLEAAVRFLEALGPLFEGLRAGLEADLAAAERLGRAAAQTLVVNLAVNLSAWSEAVEGAGPVAQRLDELRARLEAA